MSTEVPCFLGDGSRPSRSLPIPKIVQPKGTGTFSEFSNLAIND